MPKKNKKSSLQQLLARPWCYYCNRTFDDLKVLIAHQRVKHFRCEKCSRRLNTAGGLAVHMQQVHKGTLTFIANSIKGRSAPDIEIFGIEGIPQEAIVIHQVEIIREAGKEQEYLQMQHRIQQQQMYGAFYSQMTNLHPNNYTNIVNNNSNNPNLFGPFSTTAWERKRARHVSKIYPDRIKDRLKAFIQAKNNGFLSSPEQIKSWKYPGPSDFEKEEDQTINSKKNLKSISSLLGSALDFENVKLNDLEIIKNLPQSLSSQSEMIKNDLKKQGILNHTDNNSLSLPIFSYETNKEYLLKMIIPTSLSDSPPEFITKFLNDKPIST